MNRNRVARRRKKLWRSLQPEWLIDLGPGPATGQTRVMGEAYGAKARWPDIKIIGVEPNPRRVRLQRRAHYPGALLKYAVTDQDDQQITFHNKGNWSSIYAPHADDVKRHGSITVDTITLDTLNEQHGPFTKAIIWADIQGAELSMLKGAKDLLQSGEVIAINLEVMPGLNNNAEKRAQFAGWASEAELTAYLKSVGFVRGFPPPTDDRQYDMLYIPA